jgi:hypothetical protein
MKLGRKICNKGTPTTCSVSRFFAPLPLVPLTSGLCSGPRPAPARVAALRRRPAGPAAGTREKPAGHAFRAWRRADDETGRGAARGDRGPAMRHRARPHPPRESRESAGRRPARRRCKSRVKGPRERETRGPREPREARASEMRDGMRRREEIGRATAQGHARCRRPAAGAVARERLRRASRRPGAGRAAQPRVREKSLPDMRFEGGAAPGKKRSRRRAWRSRRGDAASRPAASAARLARERGPKACSPTLREPREGPARTGGARSTRAARGVRERRARRRATTRGDRVGIALGRALVSQGASGASGAARPRGVSRR